MKICIVSNFYPPHARGGAELVASRTSDVLYERGHEVVVLTTQPYEGLRSLFPHVCERTLEAVYRFFPLNIYYLGQDQRMPFAVRIIWHVIDLLSPFGRAAINTLIQDERPDVVITHNLKGIGVSIGRAIQKQGIPHVHVLHDVQWSIPSGLLLAGKEDHWLHRSFLRRWYEAAVKRELGKPDIVISPSRFLAEFYRARGLFTASRIEHLPNPAPVQPVEPRGDRPACRTKFLYVGQLEPHKGIKELLRAFDAFSEDVELHIAGEGSLADLLIQRAQRDARVNFHGFISLDHLLELLRTTDAVIVPSVCYENSPTVIYESYMVGVPVVASNIGGIPELVKNGETGLLVKPGDETDLARAMRLIHEHRDAWWGRSETIRQQARPYSIQTYVDRLERLLVELVSK